MAQERTERANARQNSAVRDFKIRDATAVRRGRKWIFKEVTYCACSRRRPDGITSSRERGFANFDVLYKTFSVQNLFLPMLQLNDNKFL